MSSLESDHSQAWWWKAGTALLIVALLAGVVALQYSLESSDKASGASDSTPFEAGRSILDVLGGVRQSLAAVLWTKTDALFHSYLGHSLKTENLIFPYFWLITRLDPNFEMPYYFASYTLCTYGKVKEGFNLALEGIRNNPYSAILQQNLAEIYLYYKRDPEKALYHINRAIALEGETDDSGDLATVNFATLKDTIEKVLTGEVALPSHSDLEKKRHQNAIESCEECQHELEHEHEHEHEHED